MRRHGAVDIDKQAESWRQQGWSRFDERGATPHDVSRERRQVSRESQTSATQQREGVIPVVQEEIQVEKRQIQTGDVRVYSHISEVPVQEEVHLREERAKVERQAVDRPATEAERDAFQERSFEIPETTEEPVISKQARVKEEVRIVPKPPSAPR